MEECLEKCLELAKISLEVYEEMEKHDGIIAEMYNAKKAGRLLDYCLQREFKPGTPTNATLMSLEDFAENRRSYYEVVVEHLTPIVALQKK